MRSQRHELAATIRRAARVAALRRAAELTAQTFEQARACTGLSPQEVGRRLEAILDEEQQRERTVGH
jgi:hypothetical protein